MPWHALRVSATDGSHGLFEVDDPAIVGPIDHAFRATARATGGRAPDVTVLGTGPLAGSPVPGSNRLVVAGHSPLWDTFFPSTIGGAGVAWNALGIRTLELSGCASSPSVLVLARRRGELGVALHAIDLEEAWRLDEHGDHGLYALMRRVLARHGEGLVTARVLAVGPAAARTRAGAIGSAPVRGGVLTHVDTWAGRGGMGSRLLRVHGLAAIVYGADTDPAGDDATERAAIERRFVERYGKPAELVGLEKTARYRVDPTFRTGGTFGANFTRLRDRGLSFNYRSVHMSDATRLAIHERLVEGHYLAQFRDEIIAPRDGKRKSSTCGEPCALACKKVDGRHKKDYEPYQALGPLVGVFDQRAAERLTRLADSAGFDAIQIGGEVAWVMEGLHAGWLGEAETGIAARPAWDPDELEPAAGSAHNGEIAARVIRWILGDPRAGALREGLRTAARAVGGPGRDAAVYSASGDAHGCMVPNQYWVPGMFAPVPILGRYYLDYTYDWQPPAELGRSCAGRMVAELMLDNLGICRFHRGWAEELLPEIGRDLCGGLDVTAHHQGLARTIATVGRPRPWETRRVVDIVRTYLTKYRDDGPPEPELDRWVARFGEDAPAAAEAYWVAIRQGFVAAIEPAAGA